MLWFPYSLQAASTKETMEKINIRSVGEARGGEEGGEDGRRRRDKENLQALGDREKRKQWWAKM